jgi:hypothetical protein
MVQRDLEQALRDGDEQLRQSQAARVTWVLSAASPTSPPERLAASGDVSSRALLLAEHDRLIVSVSVNGVAISRKRWDGICASATPPPNLEGNGLKIATRVLEGSCRNLPDGVLSLLSSACWMLPWMWKETGRWL